MVPAERVAVLSPHLVNYGFVRELVRRDFRIVEVPVEEYWDLAVNGVTLEPGKVVINQGSPTVVVGARAGRRRGDPGRLLGEPEVRDRRPALRHARARPRPAGLVVTVAELQGRDGRLVRARPPRPRRSLRACGRRGLRRPLARRLGRSARRSRRTSGRAAPGSPRSRRR